MSLVKVIAVEEEPNIHLEFCQRVVTDGMRSLWKFLFTSLMCVSLPFKRREREIHILNSASEMSEMRSPWELLVDEADEHVSAAQKESHIILNFASGMSLKE